MVDKDSQSDLDIIQVLLRSIMSSNFTDHLWDKLAKINHRDTEINGVNLTGKKGWWSSSLGVHCPMASPTVPARSSPGYQSGTQPAFWRQRYQNPTRSKWLDEAPPQYMCCQFGEFQGLICCSELVNTAQSGPRVSAFSSVNPKMIIPIPSAVLKKILI